VIKTHTPLDGISLDLRVTYLVVARHPLDAAVSLYHQAPQHRPWRLRRFPGTEESAASVSRPPVREWLAAWIERDPDPGDELDSLPGPTGSTSPCRPTYGSH